MDQKAQGALEYLIITAAVLAIAAVVVTVISGAFGGGQASADVSQIQADAADCSQVLASEGKPIGTPDETLCGDICEAAKNTDKATTTTAAENSLGSDVTVYDACIAGKADWIRQKS